MELLAQIWSLLGLLTVLQNVLPSQLLSLLHTLWQSLTPYSYFDVPEFLGSSAVEPNHLYRHVSLYLHHTLLLHTPSPTPRLTLGVGVSSSSSCTLSLSPNHALPDSFAGHRLLWAHHAETLNDSLEERRSFSLRIPKRHASAILRPYLAAVTSAAATAVRDRRLYTNGGAAGWVSVPFRHHATFDTLALEPEMRSSLVDDLDAFSGGGEFYKRTGRAWKRGYLLHGPPGSGKSSLIAAMANHLQYDVYDLELTRVGDNSELRALLMQTTNRSLIVIEDIDCSLDLTGDRMVNKLPTRKRKKSKDSYDEDHTDSRGGGRVTLSGLLNFIDGLWSCCGEERVIVFTTNHVDGIDPALLRPGRMDVHVRLGACGPLALRELVSLYVGAADRDLMAAAEGCVAAGAAVTPAEASELLLRRRGDPDAAVGELVAELRSRLAGAGGESPEGSWEMTSPAKKGKVGWEGRVRLLGRLRSLTKSDSGRRGV